MKKKLVLTSMALTLASSFAIMPAFAAVDPTASVNSMLSSLGGSTVTAEAYTQSLHLDLKKSI
ncbi:hypothetical protein [Paenibacillus arenilitoris]|uniref:Uncharacterized protein n=1 Tax=Paenibacillus arenilitoris TaxID=2772299 RepID=A0A927CSH7_9BACL|nr:hypothetical protein [Paenibacillus arenilitoris]MBD2872392.1 hypothetical protein [Paenibacillus arenilitoris]